MTIEEIRSRTGEVVLKSVRKSMRFRWLDHVSRMSDNLLSLMRDTLFRISKQGHEWQECRDFRQDHGDHGKHDLFFFRFIYTQWGRKSPPLSYGNCAPEKLQLIHSTLIASQQFHIWFYSQCGRHKWATVCKLQRRRVNRKDWNPGQDRGHSHPRRTSEHPELLL